MYAALIIYLLIATLTQKIQAGCCVVVRGSGGSSGSGGGMFGNMFGFGGYNPFAPLMQMFTFGGMFPFFG